MSLIFGEMGQFAQEDPFQFDVRMKAVVAAARSLMSKDDYRELAKLVNSLVDACHGARWIEAEQFATRVEGVVDSVEYRVRGRMLAAFTMGKVLSRWDQHSAADSRLKDLEETLKRLSAKVVPDSALEQELIAIAREYNGSDSVTVVYLPHRAYSRVRRELVHEAM